MNVLLLMTVITVGSWGVGHARCPSLTNFSASNRCARFYEHSSCRGRFLQVNKGEEAGTLPPGWDNRASSVLVARGCRLIIYLHTNFRGSSRYIYNGVISSLVNEPRGWGTNWNDAISSYKCEIYKTTGGFRGRPGRSTTTSLPKH